MVWILNENRIDTAGTKYRKLGKKRKLIIKNLTYEDSGVYECAMHSNFTRRGKGELWGKENKISNGKLKVN